MRIDWGGRPAEIREAGQGPAILLLHGFPLDGAMWSGVARLLAPRLRVLKPDLPGRENTPAEADGMEGYADFVEAVLRELPAPVGLAGFSMGGYVALALMKRRPEKIRALALVDTRAAADDAAGKAKRDEAIAKLRAEGVRAIADSMVEKLLAHDSLRKGELVERVRRIMLRQDPKTIAADLKAMKERPDSTTFLSEISVPALVVVGEQDVLTPPSEAREMAAAIPGARLVTIPEAGHLTPMERPKAVAEALGDFFVSTLAD